MTSNLLVGNNQDDQEDNSGNECLVCQQILSPPPQQLTTKHHSSNNQQPISPNTTTLTFTPSQPAWECAFSPCGRWLAVAYGAPNPVIRLWKWCPAEGNEDTTTTPAMTPQHRSPFWALHSTLAGIHEKTVRSVQFAPLPNAPQPILASASFDGTAAIWEMDNNEWISTAQLEGHDTEVKCVRWNATASLLATCGRDKSVWIWECFLDGTVGGGGAGDHEFECLAVLNGHQGDVKSIQFCPSHGAWGDGDEILLSASYDDTVKCWAEDGGDWYCAFTVTEPNCQTLWSLAVSPSGARLVAGAGDGSIRLYKCYTKQEAQQEEDAGGGAQWKGVGLLSGAHLDASPVYSVSYAPAVVGHGRIASCGGDNRLQILREASTSTLERPQFSTEVSVLTDHGDVNSVAWHPCDGSVLVSAGDDGRVRVWKYTCRR